MHTLKSYTLPMLALSSILFACSDDDVGMDVGVQDATLGDLSVDTADLAEDMAVDGNTDNGVEDLGMDASPNVGEGVVFGSGGECEQLFDATASVFPDAGDLVDCATIAEGAKVARSLLNVNSLTIDNDGEALEPCVAVRCDSNYAYIASNAVPHYDFIRTGRNPLVANSYLSRVPLTVTDIPSTADADSWESIDGCTDAYAQYLSDPSEGTMREPSTLCSQGNRVSGRLFDEINGTRDVVDRLPCFNGTALSINGVPIYAPNEALVPNAYGNPGYNYPSDTNDTYGSGPSLDFCGAHSGRSMHHHAVNDRCFERDSTTSEPALSYAEATANWDIAAAIDGDCSDGPSGIVGWAADGHPIRGGCICITRDDDGACTEVRRARSSWTYEGLKDWGEDSGEEARLGVEGMTCTSDSDCCTNNNCDFSCSPSIFDDGAGGTEVANRCVLISYSWCIHQYELRDTPSAANYMHLDRCNGFDGPDGYAYHTTFSFPYLLGCYRGDPSGAMVQEAE